MGSKEEAEENGHEDLLVRSTDHASSVFVRDLQREEVKDNECRGVIVNDALYKC